MSLFAVGWHGRTKKRSTIFFPENLVLFGNLALFLWIVLDSVAFFYYIISQAVLCFCSNSYLDLWFGTALSGLPSSLLQLYKMHAWYGALGSLYFGRRILRITNTTITAGAVLFSHSTSALSPAAFALYSAIVDFAVNKAAVFVVSYCLRFIVA
jgi:hypothetical protein